MALENNGLGHCIRKLFWTKLFRLGGLNAERERHRSIAMKAEVNSYDYRESR